VLLQWNISDNISETNVTKICFLKRLHAGRLLRFVQVTEPHLWNKLFCFRHHVTQEVKSSWMSQMGPVFNRVSSNGLKGKLVHTVTSRRNGVTFFKNRVLLQRNCVTPTKVLTIEIFLS
jgi:hypothetical protein